MLMMVVQIMLQLMQRPGKNLYKPDTTKMCSHHIMFFFFAIQMVKILYLSLSLHYFSECPRACFVFVQVVKVRSCLTHPLSLTKHIKSSVLFIKLIISLSLFIQFALKVSYQNFSFLNFSFVKILSFR